jgi:hypothetical protein
MIKMVVAQEKSETFSPKPMWERSQERYFSVTRSILIVALTDWKTENPALSIDEFIEKFFSQMRQNVPREFFPAIARMAVEVWESYENS